MSIVAHDLVGTWRLVSWVVRSADGTSSEPLGADPCGLLVYTADGAMSGQMMRTGRPRLRRPRQTAADVGEDDPEELAAAFNGYVAYFGSYELDTAGGVVCHRVEGALIPNWEGIELRRTVTMDGDVLVLRTPPAQVRGGMQTDVLRWRRAGSVTARR